METENFKKKRLIFMLLSLFVGAITYVLCVLFFGWKALLVLLLFDFYKNAESEYKKPMPRTPSFQDRLNKIFLDIKK